MNGLLKAAIAVALTVATYLLLPGSLAAPPGSPGNSDSLDRQSVVALLSSPSGDNFSTRLSWDWSVENGSTHPTLFATVSGGAAARGSLILGGPIAHLVADCHLNGVAITPVEGMPNDLGFKIPHDIYFSFDGRTTGTITRIDFSGDAGPGGQVIYCSAAGLGADDPPLHRLYTPDLLAFAGDSQTASLTQLRSVCVGTTPSITKGSEQCADQNRLVPAVYASDQLITLPDEQGMRDARLILLGSLAGASAAVLADFLGWILARATTGPAVSFAVAHLVRVRRRPQSGA